MPSYFTSDVHLRLDRPERSRRFADWVDRLDPHDSLTIVGDLCDFWFAARQCGAELASDAGLKALVQFRDRGGALTILTGNHDAWLGPFYQQSLGARVVSEPYRLEAYGLRLLMLHGHRLGGHPGWKGWMETRSFLKAFHRLPSPVATALDLLLERRNDQKREVDDQRQLDTYRQFAASCAGSADIVLIGHVHRPLDQSDSIPRLVVPGGWFGRAGYVKIDASGASLVVESDPSPIPC